MLANTTPSASQEPSETIEQASSPTARQGADQQTGSQNGERQYIKRWERQRPPSLINRLQSTQEAAPRFSPMEMSAQDLLKADSTLPTPTGLTSTTPIAATSSVTGALPTGTLTPPLPQVPIDNMAVHIASQARAGHQQFNIRLDPPELGRIDIKLEIGADGSTLTHLAVEKPETLDLCARTARALERALANAGLDSRNGSLSFSLKEDNQGGDQADNDDEDGHLSSDASPREDIEAS